MDRAYDIDWTIISINDVIPGIPPYGTYYCLQCLEVAHAFIRFKDHKEPHFKHKDHNINCSYSTSWDINRWDKNWYYLMDKRNTFFNTRIFSNEMNEYFKKLYLNKNKNNRLKNLLILLRKNNHKRTNHVIRCYMDCLYSFIYRPTGVAGQDTFYGWSIDYCNEMLQFLVKWAGVAIAFNPKESFDIPVASSIDEEYFSEKRKLEAIELAKQEQEVAKQKMAAAIKKAELEEVFRKSHLEQRKQLLSGWETREVRQGILSRDSPDLSNYTLRVDQGIYRFFDIVGNNWDLAGMDWNILKTSTYRQCLIDKNFGIAVFVLIGNSNSERTENDKFGLIMRDGKVIFGLRNKRNNLPTNFHTASIEEINKKYPGLSSVVKNHINTETFNQATIQSDPFEAYGVIQIEKIKGVMTYVVTAEMNRFLLEKTEFEYLTSPLTNQLIEKLNSANGKKKGIKVTVRLVKDPKSKFTIKKISHTG